MRKINKSFFETYISSQVWIGKMYIDGGWGNKAKVMDIFPEPEPVLSTKMEPVQLTPDFDMIENEKSSAPEHINFRYSVIFMGMEYAQFVKKVHEVMSVCQKKMVWILDSVDGKTGEKLPLRFTINYEKGSDPVFTVYEGKMSPDFSKPVKISSTL